MSHRSAASVFRVGDVLVWEPDQPHARCVVRVKQTIWNGEEWWYLTEDIVTFVEARNDEGRMVEACVPYSEWAEQPIGAKA